MKKFPDNDAFKKINKLVFEFNRRLSYPWTVHFDDFEGTLKLQKVKCDGMLYNAQINTLTYKTYVIFNYDMLNKIFCDIKREIAKYNLENLDSDLAIGVICIQIFGIIILPINLNSMLNIILHTCFG